MPRSSEVTFRMSFRISSPPMLPHKYNNIATISGHSSPISVVLFSFDGKYLASGSDDGTILINATRSWKVVKRLTNVSPVTALMWDPTLPMMLLCGFATGAVVTVHIGHGDQVRTHFYSHSCLAEISTLAVI